MVRKATKSKLTWKRDGPVAAQLFRDLYFKKYRPNPNGEFNVNEIYRDPTRQYQGLNQSTFKGHITSTWERVQNYRDQGTGLGSEKFRKLIRLHEPPEPEDQQPVHHGESDQDSSYNDNDEEDISLEGFESDSGASQAVEQGEIQDINMSEKKTPGKKESGTTVTVDNNVKYAFNEPDGRMGFCYHVPSGFDGTFELNEANTKVMKKEVQHSWTYNAEAVYARMGLSANNVHVVGLQAVMDEKKRRDVVAMGQNPDEWEGEIYIRSEAFDIGQEVEPYFIDHNGEETTDVWIDASSEGGEWVFFWLKKKVPRVARSARLNRNRNRRRPVGEPDTNPRRPGNVHVEPDGEEGDDSMSGI